MKDTILDMLEKMLVPLFFLIVIVSIFGGIAGGAIIGVGGGFVGAVVGLVQGVVVGALSVGVIFLLFDIRDSLSAIEHRIKKHELKSE